MEPGSWEYYFRILCIWQKTHGHCDVPVDERIDGLGCWLARQIEEAKAGQLGDERSRRLVEVGVVLHPAQLSSRDEKWDQKYRALCHFKDAHGHCQVPRDYPACPGLRQWLGQQRLRARKELLTPLRHEMLEAIGVDFGSQRGPCATWEQRFAQLEEFKARFGHCRVRKGWEENPALAIWLNNQRQTANAGRLPSVRVRQLKDLGVKWGSPKSLWDRRYEELAAFQREHGHARVCSKGHGLKQLACWIAGQRTKRRLGQLSSARIRKLEEIGFEWKAGGTRREPRYERQWDQCFATLSAFKDTHGHCHVPWQYPASPGLYPWTARQRRLAQAGRLSPEKTARLDALGFEWIPIDPRWEASFAKVAAFAREHGHCCVPMLWQGDRTLGQWVLNQRQRRRKGLLGAHLVQRLEAIGFEWSRPVRSTFLRDIRWQKHFEQLRAFQQRHGHCEVSRARQEDICLADWVSRQRRFYQAGKVSAKCVRQLEELGFRWEFERPEWDLRVQELAEWRRVHGHCRVTRSSEDHYALAGWIVKQRARRKRGMLSAQSIRRLDEIGFEWNLDSHGQPTPRGACEKHSDILPDTADRQSSASSPASESTPKLAP